MKDINEYVDINESLNKDRFPSKFKELKELGANNDLIEYFGHSSEGEITSQQLLDILIMIYKDIKNNK